MSNNGQNNGLTMVFAFFTGFMAGAVISLLYAPVRARRLDRKFATPQLTRKTGRLN